MNDQNPNGGHSHGGDNDSYYRPSGNGGPESQGNGQMRPEQGPYGGENFGYGANANAGSSAGMSGESNANPGYGNGGNAASGYGNQYGGYGAPSGGQPNGNAHQQSSVKAESRGFFEALFDFSFSSFITIKFAKFVYALCIIVVAFIYLASVIAAFSSGGGEGVLTLFFGALVALVQIIFTRVALEGIISIVRTAQNTAVLREVATGQQ